MSEFMSGFMLEPHLAYNWMIVVYFFLGGLAAGAYLLSVASLTCLPSLRPFARGAALVAPLALAPGLLVLLLDLGIPARGALLGIHFNPTAVLSWGSIFLGLFFLVSVVHAYCLWKGDARVPLARKVALIGVPSALVTAAYTGILLNRAPGFVLWHNALLPVLFVNGGLISGGAATLLVSMKSEAKEGLAILGRLVAGLVVLEVLMVACELAVLIGGGAHAQHAAAALMHGEWSVLFWGIQIVAGAIIPSVILASRKAPGGLRAAAAILALIGVYVMRHIVVIGGQHIG